MKTTDVIKKIHLSDYRTAKLPYLRVFGLMKNIPETFYQKCLPLNPNSNLENFLRKINFIIHKNAGKKKRNAKSFEESRFLTARQILKRGIISCGANAALFSAVLRKRGIPTKLIHGKLRDSHNDNRHAWIKIYNPLNKNWLVIDVTQNDFSLHLKAYPIREYQDWSELKKDYKNGKW
ncbi:transglutaminase domain-containing protein [Candidatus Wolfebacteria bacterium]|nr:transglutaminase domain-containing protein [Candidatus Wolfebacteria bacterium]